VATYLTSLASPWPAADLFNYMARFSNAAEWDPGVVEATEGHPGRPELGSTYRLVVSFFGRRLALDYEIVEIDTPHRVVLRAENSMVCSTDVIEVVPTSGGARLTYQATLRPKGASAWIAPVLTMVFPRIGDRAAAGLKAKLAI
jgi:hypothetical protein